MTLPALLEQQTKTRTETNTPRYRTVGFGKTKTTPWFLHGPSTMKGKNLHSMHAGLKSLEWQSLLLDPQLVLHSKEM